MDSMKKYVLVQMMQTLAPGRVYVFCSDDFPARQSLSTLPAPIRPAEGDEPDRAVPIKTQIPLAHRNGQGVFYCY